MRTIARTPSIDRIFPNVTFEDLEKPLGIKPPEIYQPLTRYIETTSESYLYAIADRRDWSVIESIRGLALLFPVGLWLLRWRALENEPTVQDMLHIVVALDRSQGYAPLTGAFYRFRLSTLSTHSELQRLVVWYAG